MIRATLVYVFIGGYLLVMAPVAILWTVIRGSTVFLYRAARFCLRVAGWISGLEVVVLGKEKLSPKETYIFLSNHQCNLDGPLICWATQRDLRAIVKKEVMKIPMLSFVLRVTSFVPIDRMDAQSARSSLDRGAELMKQGLSFFAFPEGTRSRDGRLGPFKKGVFLMALKSGVPIVPVSINAASVQTAGEYAIRPGTVEVIFHDPLPTARLSPEDRDKLVDATRDAIASGLRDLEVPGA